MPAISHDNETKEVLIVNWNLRFICISIIVFLLPISTSCISESDVMRSTNEAVYQSVMYGEEPNMEDEVIGIRSMAFYEGGSLVSYIDYPPLDISSEMTWKIGFASDMVTVSDETGFSWKYRFTEEGLLLKEADGEEVEPTLYEYVGDRDDALNCVDSILADNFTGGVESTTLHLVDAEAVYKIIDLAGYDSGVLIDEYEGEVFFTISFRGVWFLNGNNYDEVIQRVIASLTAIGLVSKYTSWSSSSNIIFFEDCIWALSTAECRELVTTYEFPLAIALYPDYDEMLELAYHDNDFVEPGGLRTLYDRLGTRDVVSREQFITLIEYYNEDRGLQLNDVESVELACYLLWVWYYKLGQDHRYWAPDQCQSIINAEYFTADQAEDILLRDDGIYFNEFSRGLGSFANYTMTIDVVLRGVAQYIDDHVAFEGRGLSQH